MHVPRCASLLASACRADAELAILLELLCLCMHRRPQHLHFTLLLERPVFSTG